VNRGSVVALATIGFAALVAQIAVAGGAEDSSGPKATASASVNKQLKQLKQRVAKLETQGGQPGPQGLQGPAGSPDTPADVLAKLIQVDGGGTGLDADLLDGQNSSAFLASSAPAGGDLSGSFSNLQIAANAVGATEVVNATSAQGLRRADIGILGGLFDVDFPSQAADSCSLQTISGITGAQNGDLVIANPRSSPGLMAIPLDVANANEVDFFVCNVTGGAVNPPEVDWRILLIR
jgi:hypothetical protein